MALLPTYGSTQFGVVKVQHPILVIDTAIEFGQWEMDLHHAILSRKELLLRTAFVIVSNNVEATIKVAIFTQTESR